MEGLKRTREQIGDIGHPQLAWRVLCASITERERKGSEMVSEMVSEMEGGK